MRDPANPNRLNFYTVADNYGQLTVKVEAVATDVSSGYSDTKILSLNQNPFGDLPGSNFGDVINYLDARINSPELVSVPEMPVNFGGTPPTPPAIQERSLLVKTLIGIFKSTINPNLSLTKGTVEGFIGGAKSDYEGVVGVWTLITSSAQRAAAFQALTTWKTYAQIPDAIETGALNFMTEAEATGVVFKFKWARRPSWWSAEQRRAQRCWPAWPVPQKH